MVKKGSEAAFKSSAELGTQLARTEFLRQVEVEKNRGERMFQEEVEKNRGLAEAELRRRVREGKELGEKELSLRSGAGRMESGFPRSRTLLVQAVSVPFPSLMLKAKYFLEFLQRDSHLFFWRMATLIPLFRKREYQVFLAVLSMDR